MSQNFRRLPADLGGAVHASSLPQECRLWTIVRTRDNVTSHWSPCFFCRRFRAVCSAFSLHGVIFAGRPRRSFSQAQGASMGMERKKAS